MFKDIIYFNSNNLFEKRKQLFFLNKIGFNIKKINNFLNVDLKDTLLVLITSEKELELIIPHINKLPIIILLDENKYFDEHGLHNEIPNLVFFRSTTEPVHTLIETIRLIESYKN